MNLFNKLFPLPKEKNNTVTESDKDVTLESWSVEWFVKTGWLDETKRQAKVFVNNDAAKEFKKQLEDSANLLGCYVRVDIYKN